MQGLPSNIIAALRTSSETYLENFCIVLLSSELYTVVEKNECKKSTTSDRQPTGLPTRSESYRDQETGEVANHSRVTAAATRSLLNSSSSSSFDRATIYVSRNITGKRLGRSSGIPETRVAALLQASKPCFKLHICKSSYLVIASSFDASVPVPNGAVQLFITNPPCSAW